MTFSPGSHHPGSPVAFIQRHYCSTESSWPGLHSRRGNIDQSLQQAFSILNCVVFNLTSAVADPSQCVGTRVLIWRACITSAQHDKWIRLHSGLVFAHHLETRHLIWLVATKWGSLGMDEAGHSVSPPYWAQRDLISKRRRERNKQHLLLLIYLWKMRLKNHGWKIVFLLHVEFIYFLKCIVFYQAIRSSFISSLSCLKRHDDEMETAVFLPT